MYGSVTHQIHQHTTFDDRVSAAKILQNELKEICSNNEKLIGMKTPPLICVDGMENLASIAFGALPERLVILVDGKVKFIGGKGPEDYSVMECRRALEQLLSSCNE